MSDARMMMIFDFATEEQFRQWMVINDGVMGGISRSTFTKAGPAGAVFAGVVSLENYGGFCSVSSRQPAPVDASAIERHCGALQGRRQDLQADPEKRFVLRGIFLPVPFCGFVSRVDAYQSAFQ